MKLDMFLGKTDTSCSIPLQRQAEINKNLYPTRFLNQKCSKLRPFRGEENMLSSPHSTMLWQTCQYALCHLWSLLVLQFEGSDALEDKIERFSASLRNHLHWRYNEDEGPFLCSDLSLKISIEVRAQVCRQYEGQYEFNTRSVTDPALDKSHKLHARFKWRF